MQCQKHGRLATLLILSLFSVICGSSCQTAPSVNWQGKAYIGDHVNKRIYRAMGKDEIKCEDPHFSNYICMTYEDFISLFGESAAPVEQAQ